jgi:hypothetical protein
MRFKLICFLVISFGIARLSLVQADSDPVPIHIGDTVEGELTESALGVTYEVEVTELSFVSIDLRSSAFDPYVSLMNTEGELASNDDFNGGLNAHIGNFSLEPGTYSILVTSSNNTQTGAYRLALIGGSAPDLVTGVTLEGALTLGNPEQRYVWRAEAGKTYIIQANSTEVNTLINVYPMGAYEYPYYTDDDSGMGTNALAGPYTIRESQDFVIAVVANSGGDSSGGGGGGNSEGLGSSNTSKVGAYTLELLEIEPTPVSCNDEITGTVNPQGEYYRFDYTLGTKLNIDVAGDADTTLGMYNDFYNMGSDDDSGAGFNPELVNYSFRENGSYVLSVFPSTSDASGNFTLTVDCTAPTPLSLTDPATVHLNEKEHDTVVAFEDAVVGQGYALTLNPTGEYYPTYSYLDIYLDGQYYTGIYLDTTIWGTEIELLPGFSGDFTFYLSGDYSAPLDIEFSIIEKETEAQG